MALPTWHQHLERYRGYARQVRNDLRGTPPPVSSRATTRRLQQLAGMFDFPSSYLEIGVWQGHVFSAVPFDRKLGVDPRPLYQARRHRGESILRMTSDEFFAQASASLRFDVVFLDGLHTFEQTARDLWNSIDHAHKDAVWLIDDVVPANPAQAQPSIEDAFIASSAAGAPSYAWTGDVYRLAHVLSAMDELLEFRTIVGSGREQLLVWLRTNDLESVSARGRELTRLAPQRSFDDAFPNGSAALTSEFRPATELDTLAALLQSRAR